MKIFFIFFAFVNFIFAYGMKEISTAINYVGIEEKIAPRVLYTIVKIESNFNPLAISFLTDQKNAFYFKSLENENIKIKIGKYSLNKKKWVVSISPNTLRRARGIAKLLIKDGFSIDVGLGQINSTNFTYEEIDYIFEPIYNLRKSAKILKLCYKNKKKNIQKTIECYNYGYKNRSSSPYYKRFYEHFKKEFGE